VLRRIDAVGFVGIAFVVLGMFFFVVGRHYPTHSNIWRDWLLAFALVILGCYSFFPMARVVNSPTPILAGTGGEVGCGGTVLTTVGIVAPGQLSKNRVHATVASPAPQVVQTQSYVTPCSRQLTSPKSARRMTDRFTISESH